jgi:hypothetical protein
MTTLTTLAGNFYNHQMADWAFFVAYLLRETLKPA